MRGFLGPFLAKLVYQQAGRMYLASWREVITDLKVSQKLIATGIDYFYDVSAMT